MVDAGVTGVLSKLGEVASAEATALLRVDDQIRELRRRLVYLQALGRGADQQRRGRASELLLLWAQETREVAFEVEDAVDEFHLKVEAFQVQARPRRGRRSWYRSALTLLSGLAMQIVARHGLSREITKINGRIKEISEIKETYQIQSSPAEIWSASSIDAADADWDIEADKAIELRRGEFVALKKHIMEEQSKIEHRAVISIVGPSGIGKTTLARKLYNDRGVREHFKVRVWISLPPRIRFEKYLEMMYEQVRKQVPEDLQHGDGDASGKLQQLLRKHEHNYLVVLDGLVDISDWNSLVSLLPDDNPRSRILLTTQLKVKEIKPSVKQTAPIVLQPLGSTGGTKDILKLFYRRAFGFGANGSRPRVMSNLSERILKISAGLPLAIVVLSGLLRTKNFGHEWNEVLEQLEESKGQPIRCLWTLAFEDLPHHLKSCFMYFAMASDNILLDPDRLVRLWIAEGFVAPKKGKTLEEVGLGYLKQLISRGLVQAVKDARGGIKFVSVHSLLHAFAESESQESGFFEMHHHANVLKPHSMRRLALHNYVDSYVDIPNHFPKLRSLFCDFLEDQQQQGDDTNGGGNSVHQGEWHPAEWFLRACGSNSDGPAAGSAKLHDLSFIRGSRFLRVIDLYGLLLARVPDEIGSIIHLRYLGIRNCKLAALPATISKLDNLQTLDVRATRLQDVADEFWEIQGLRHVLADGLRLPKCPSAHLKHLQTLAGAVPAGAWGPSCPLSSMIYLRALAMTLISEEYMSALSQALQKMEFLVSLKLAGRLLPSSVFTNPSSRRLEVLALHGRLDAGDSVHGPLFLPNLGTLSISGSALKQDFIDKVAMLPNLAEMELLGGSYIEAHLVCPAEGFQSLKKLKLANLVQLELAVVPAPESTLFNCSGCPLLKVERLQQVAAADPAENGILSILEEPEFKDEKAYIFSEIDQVDANDPTEDQMLVRRGMEGLRYRENFEEDTADDPMEDQMLVRHGMDGLQYREHFQEGTVDDPAEDQMLVRRGKEGLQYREHFHEDTADDPMEDQMLVRRGMEGLQDMEHLQGDTADDPAEDQMLVGHGM